MKLLIVDDSSLNRKMLRRLLEAQGHVCEEAFDGLIAVDMIKKKITNVSNNSSDVTINININANNDINDTDSTGNFKVNELQSSNSSETIILRNPRKLIISPEEE